MSALVTRTAIAMLAGLVGAIAPLVQAQTDGQKKEITSPDHTVDMPGREGHGPEHMKGKKKAKNKPITSESAHTVDMPGREAHKKEATDPAGPGITTGGHTVDMPGREEHSKSHEKK